MSITDAVPESTSLGARFAVEVRVHLTRQESSIRKLAEEMGVSHVWLSRRLGASRSVEITIDEAWAVAEAIGVPLVELLTAS